MRGPFHLSVATSIPWGVGAQEIEARSVSHPSFAIVSPSQKQEIHAEVRLRLDAEGGIHILNDDGRELQEERSPSILHFTRDGERRGRTPIPRASPKGRGLRVEDFAFDPESEGYILWSSSGSRAQSLLLTKVDARGEAAWEIRLRLKRGEAAPRLFLDARGRLYVSPNPHSITELDRRDGREVRSIKLAPHVDERLFVDVSGGVYRTALLEPQNAYAMTAVRPDSDDEEVAAGSAAHYGALQLCFGVDKMRRFFAYHPPQGERSGAIVRMALGSDQIERYPLEDVVVQAGATAVFGHFMQGALSVVTRFDADGSRSERIIELPAQSEHDPFAERRLIQVDSRGLLHFLVGEAPQRSGAILVFSADGALVEVIDPAPKLRPRMSSAQSPRSWQVEGDGRVLIPVLEPSGLTLVRFSA